jgi:hypothetical protein
MMNWRPHEPIRSIESRLGGNAPRRDARAVRGRDPGNLPAAWDMSLEARIGSGLIPAPEETTHHRPSAVLFVVQKGGIVTDPLTPDGCDLRDFPHTPIFRARLFGSSFHARATDGEWRAGVTLWLKSWDQVPAGSLPDDDIELCRLAELARDLKTWKKIKSGSLRGCIKCSDERLYHPVVAEYVNHALESKAAQRSKTAKARIAALEKHLEKANDAIDKERITDEINRLRQTVLLSQSQKDLLSVTESVTESKRREGKGREGKGREGNISSVDKSTDGKPSVKSPKDKSKVELWKSAVSLLGGQGMPEPQARTFIGKLVSDYKSIDEDIVLKSIQGAVSEQPADARAYLKATCQRLAGERKRDGSRDWTAEAV